jgi:hypothetical protein
VIRLDEAEKKHAGGRPRIYDPLDIAEKYSIYVDNTEFPMIEEFCLQYGISRARFYVIKDECTELQDIEEKAAIKGQVHLTKGMINDTVKFLPACYLTKQSRWGGYKEKETVDINLSGGVTIKWEE